MNKIDYLIKKYQTGNKMSKPERMAQSAENFFDRARLLYWKLTDPKKYIRNNTEEWAKQLFEISNMVSGKKDLEKYMNDVLSLQQRIDAQNRILEEQIKQKYNKQNTWQRQ